MGRINLWDGVEGDQGKLTHIQIHLDPCASVLMHAFKHVLSSEIVLWCLFAFAVRVNTLRAVLVHVDPDLSNYTSETSV